MFEGSTTQTIAAAAEYAARCIGQRHYLARSDDELTVLIEGDKRFIVLCANAIIGRRIDARCNQVSREAFYFAGPEWLEDFDGAPALCAECIIALRTWESQLNQ